LPSLLCRVFLRLRRVLPALGEEVDSGSDVSVFSLFFIFFKTFMIFSLKSVVYFEI
jgi:hypothetical protein